MHVCVNSYPVCVCVCITLNDVCVCVSSKSKPEKEANLCVCACVPDLLNETIQECQVTMCAVKQCVKQSRSVCQIMCTRPAQ